MDVVILVLPSRVLILIKKDHKTSPGTKKRVDFDYLISKYI